MLSQPDLIQLIKTKEAEGNSEEAISAYEQILSDDPDNEKVLHRLMILYRKLKQPKKEISIINKLIRLEENKYTPSKKRKGVIAELSNKINRSVGLTDKKGKQQMPDEVEKLEKRKQNVLKKIK